MNDLARAIASAREGDLTEARARIESDAEGPSAEGIVIARLAAVVGEHDRALAILEQAATARDRDAEAALEWRIGLLVRFGRHRAALDLAARSVDEKPSARRHTWAARLHRTIYDPVSALHHLEAALALAKTRWSAREAFEMALEVAPDKAPAFAELLDDPLEIARILLHSGRPTEAEAHLPEGDGHEERSILALFRGDRASARAHALAAGDTKIAHRCLGAVALLESDPKRALAELAQSEDEETNILRAEALYTIGRTSEAEAALAKVGFSDNLAAIAVRALVRSEKLSSFSGEEGTLDASRALLRAAGIEARADDPHAVLRALRGNRSRTPTAFAEGRLHPIAMPICSRTLAQRAQRRIEHAPFEDVIAGFEPVFAAHPRSAIPYCYRGELHLWFGDLDRAEADFDRAIAMEPRTFWAWVGKGAVEILRGTPERALATFDRIVQTTGRVGPTLFVYRGEARRLVGDLDGAIADLSRSVEERGTRIGAWVNLALARIAKGLDTAAIAVELRERAPVLVSDAARELGLSPAITDLPSSLYEHVLVMARGNRSSAYLTYFTRENELRFVSRGYFDRDEELADLAAIVARM